MERRPDRFAATERTYLYVEDEDEKINLVIPIFATLVGIPMTIFAAAIGGFRWGLAAYLLFGAVQCGNWAIHLGRYFLLGLIGSVLLWGIFAAMLVYGFHGF
ncbi:hypothetical protein KC967_01305 [Candidatus Saccharibacteria bacterium]|nr:hypothetical protein [Candidatus Saccharibacteria bacterium]